MGSQKLMGPRFWDRRKALTLTKTGLPAVIISHHLNKVSAHARQTNLKNANPTDWKHQARRLYGYMAIWISICMLYGYMDIWLYGYIAIWLYGYRVIEQASRKWCRRNKSGRESPNEIQFNRGTHHHGDTHTLMRTRTTT